LEGHQGVGTTKWARQGSSARGAPDDGVALREGDYVVVVDPQITLGVPIADVQAGATANFRLDIHHWESDHGTERVRAAFTDLTLKYMLTAFKAAKVRSQDAREALSSWLAATWQQAARRIPAAVAPIGPWIEVGLQFETVVELLVDLLRSDDDDCLDMHRLVLQTRGNGQTVEWQVTGPGGTPSGWKIGPGVERIHATLMDGTRSNVLDVSYRIRLIV